MLLVCASALGEAEDASVNLQSAKSYRCTWCWSRVPGALARQMLLPGV